VLGIQSVQAQVAIAALHHNDSVKIYSSNAIQSAVDDAVAGDTIYLSEGIFAGFTVRKPIAIIGAGQTTIISTSIALGQRGNPIESGLLLSGLNIIQSVHFYGIINGARIMQCKINDTCDFEEYGSYVSFDNIDIIMSQIGSLAPNVYVKGLTVVASKIAYIPSGGADEGSVTILNCNIAEDNSNKINFVNCIIPNLGSSVYTNCLYINSSSGSVIHDCYQNDFTLDDDLNCSLTDEQLKTAGFLGPNGTWVGITGGEVKFSLVTPVAQVVDHSLEVDQVERKLKVTLKLGNK
jgi:hypothetical protein